MEMTLLRTETEVLDQVETVGTNEKWVRRGSASGRVWTCPERRADISQSRHVAHC